MLHSPSKLIREVDAGDASDTAPKDGFHRESATTPQKREDTARVGADHTPRHNNGFLHIASVNTYAFSIA